jgi:integrase
MAQRFVKQAVMPDSRSGTPLCRLSAGLYGLVNLTVRSIRMKNIFLYGRKFRYPRGDLLKQMYSLICLLAFHPSPFDARSITTRANTRQKRKKISYKTRADRSQSLLRIAKDLLTECGHPRYLTQIKRCHVLKLLCVWKKRKLGVSAVKNNLCYLRVVLWLAGVDVKNVVPSNRAALHYMGLPTCRTYVSGPKAWESHKIDPFSLILERVMKVDPRVAAVLFLCYSFGLRLKEAMLWHTKTGVGANGLIHVHHGAKSGRHRDVVLQCHMLEKMAIEYATRFENPLTGSLVPGMGKLGDKDLKKFRRRIYTVARFCGITKKELGITIHGLRHSATCRWYFEITGTLAPILGGGPVDYLLDRKARTIISRRLGHARLSITDVYLGKPNTYEH